MSIVAHKRIVPSIRRRSPHFARDDITSTDSASVCERRQARGSPPSSFHFPSFAGISGMAFLPVRSLDRHQIREAMFKAS